jgi:predicted lipoprotein with Yx(FWY)xxD motif
LTNSKYTYDLDIYSAYATYGQNSKNWLPMGARFESYKKAVLNGTVAYKDDYFTVSISVNDLLTI